MRPGKASYWIFGAISAYAHLTMDPSSPKRWTPRAIAGRSYMQMKEKSSESIDCAHGATGQGESRTRDGSYWVSCVQMEEEARSSKKCPQCERRVPTERALPRPKALIVDMLNDGCDRGGGDLVKDKGAALEEALDGRKRGEHSALEAQLQLGGEKGGFPGARGFAADACCARQEAFKARSGVCAEHGLDARRQLHVGVVGEDHLQSRRHRGDNRRV